MARSWAARGDRAVRSGLIRPSPRPGRLGPRHRRDQRSGRAVGGGVTVRVLVGDDERLLADTVAVGLRRSGLAVDVCYDGNAAYERVTVNRYDVAVLDRDMPGQTGDEVCRAVLAHGLGTRSLLLTAAASIRDRVD